MVCNRFRCCVTTTPDEVEMPELPEVEHAARVLRAAIAGRRIVGVRVLHPALRRTLPPSAQRRLAGHVVRDVVRRGKHQVLHLDNGTALVAHFRITGVWAIGGVDDAREPYSSAELEVEDGWLLTIASSHAISTSSMSSY